MQLPSYATYKVVYSEEFLESISHIDSMADWQHTYVRGKNLNHGEFSHYKASEKSTVVEWAGYGPKPDFIRGRDYRYPLYINTVYLVPAEACWCPMRTLNSRGCQCGGY